MSTKRPRLARGLLDVEGAAKRMGVGKDAIYIGIHTGVIPHIRLGARIIIPEPAFERLLSEGMPIDTEGQETKRS